MEKQKRKRSRIPPEIRFWKYVNKTESCWLWTGAARDFGYGVINVDGKAERAHRLSWMLHNGPITNGLFVCHKCDNPLCVNPGHLFLGSNADNMRDCAQKGRARGPCLKGEAHGCSKLTDETVRLIRQEYADKRPYLKTLAAKYAVSPQTIHRIVRGDAWKHVPMGDCRWERRISKKQPSKHRRAKLDGEKVADIKRRYAAGERLTYLATDYGMSNAAIFKIVNGETWKHIQITDLQPSA